MSVCQVTTEQAYSQNILNDFTNDKLTADLSGYRHRQAGSLRAATRPHGKQWK